MSENKKYYYMKLKENFFSSERMVVLEMMPDGILYSNLLLKMYLMSLKHNGVLLLHENLPHTPQTIATFTRHQIGTVERALQIFLKLGFVELLTDGAYYMPDIQLLVGRSSTEAERKRRERLRLQAQKLLPNAKADICPPENNGIHEQLDGGLHQAEPQPLRPEDSRHRPHHASLCGRPVFCGDAGQYL